MSFVHLHNHTQYSVLDGACRIDKMIDKAVEYNMPAVAMTDHGTMCGAIDFYLTAVKKGIKPIIGMEAYIINGNIRKEEDKKKTRHHLVLLAQNKQGYNNLIKLSSISYTDGFYYKPRIDKTLLQKHADGLICLSGCVKGEIASLILQRKYQEAEETVAWFKDVFPGRYYLEIMKHELDDEQVVMPEIIELAHKTDTPLVVTNDCHYLNKEDAQAHDVLLCIQTGKTIDDEKRMRYDTNQLYFKSEEEMKQLFPEEHQACDNTVKIAAQVDLELTYDTFLLPKVDMPSEFKSKNEYLKQLCYEGAKGKYPQITGDGSSKTITGEIEERIDYELQIIKRMGFEDYFLIVKDLIDSSRARGIPVGPGRGSAAGSIISYLLGITQMDPIEHGLLFERFLNPGRIEMPDIDIDFCAEYRNKVIEYVVNNYGRNSVAQIITISTLKAKSVIKDVARVLGISPSESNKMTKLMLSTPNATLDKCINECPEFVELMNSKSSYTSVLKYARVLEGLIRQHGVHAAGVVIGPGDLSNYVPLAVGAQKDNQSALLVQYEGKWLDYLKMLKMDILGLNTLTIIRKTLEIIKQSTGKDIDIENVPLEDKKVFSLFSRGHTDGIFQFESAGMKKHLKELQPNRFSDLVAMVALYRPGPMQYIETYISRKYGHEKVTYDHPMMENALKETYGVIIYQEQVMQIAREMCGFSGGEADTLRKAMGKKIMEVMDKLKPKFIEGAKKNGVPEHIVTKVWDKCLEFAKYAFNKSHSVCYAYVSFQTAYLKAHYPTEFMAALLSQENEPAKIPYFMEECRNMGLEVIPPNVNRSAAEFIVQDNKILFGMRAIKNVGDAAIQKLIEEREDGGKYKDIFEMCSRIDLMAVNRAVLESLIYSGALDELQGSRRQQTEVLDIAIEYGNSINLERKRGQQTLFSLFESREDSSGIPDGSKPALPDVPGWDLNTKLEKEKQVLGFYVSGHPLSKYQFELQRFTNMDTKKYLDKNISLPYPLMIAGIVSQVDKRKTSRNRTFCTAALEDLYGKFELVLFGEDVDKISPLLQVDRQYLIVGKCSNYRKNNGAYDNEREILRIIPQRVIPMDKIAGHIEGDIYIDINENQANTKLFKVLEELSREAPGNFRLNLRVTTANFGCLQLIPQKMSLYLNKKVYETLSSIGPNDKIDVSYELLKAGK